MKLIKEDGERSLKGDFQKKLEDLFDGLRLSFFDPEPQDRLFQRFNEGDVVEYQRDYCGVIFVVSFKDQQGDFISSFTC